MTKRSELIKEIMEVIDLLDEDFKWVEKYGYKKYWEVISELVLAREAKMLDEIEKPLKRDVDIMGIEKVNMCVRDVLAIINRLRKE